MDRSPREQRVRVLAATRPCASSRPPRAAPSAVFRTTQKRSPSETCEYRGLRHSSHCHLLLFCSLTFSLTPGPARIRSVLPPGTSVWPHVYSHHLDPRNFAPYTAEFWPERWLLASGLLDPSDPSARGVSPSSPRFRHDESGFIPFSIGPMNCVGKTLAMQEMRMVLCAVLQKFQVRAKEGWDPRTYRANYRDYVAARMPKLPVVLEVR